MITSQLRTALIFNKNIKATNYQIDTYKKIIHIYGIAFTSEEKDLVISEAKEILDVEDGVVALKNKELDIREQENEDDKEIAERKLELEEEKKMVSHLIYAKPQRITLKYCYPT